MYYFNLIIIVILILNIKNVLKFLRVSLFNIRILVKFWIYSPDCQGIGWDLITRQSLLTGAQANGRQRMAMSGWSNAPAACMGARMLNRTGRSKCASQWWIADRGAYGHRKAPPLWLWSLSWTSSGCLEDELTTSIRRHPESPLEQSFN